MLRLRRPVLSLELGRTKQCVGVYCRQGPSYGEAHNPASPFLLYTPILLLTIAVTWSLSALTPFHIS